MYCINTKNAQIVTGFSVAKDVMTAYILYNAVCRVKWNYVTTAHLAICTTYRGCFATNVVGTSVVIVFTNAIATLLRRYSTIPVVDVKITNKQSKNKKIKTKLEKA